MTLMPRPLDAGSRVTDGANRFVQRTLANMPDMETHARARYGLPPVRDIQLEPPAPVERALEVAPSRSEIIAVYDRLKDKPHNMAPDQFARLEGLENGLRP
jgi:hypothetical protein